MSDKERRKLSNRLNNLVNGILELKDAGGSLVFETFQRLPLRTGTDYYKFITRPISLHSVRQKVKKQTYGNAQDFIQDIAQITWNARLYNQRKSRVYNHALILDKFLVERIIPKLSSDKTISNHSELFYPDLGPLPADDDAQGLGAGANAAIDTVSGTPTPGLPPSAMSPDVKDEDYDDGHDHMDDDEDYEEEYSSKKYDMMAGSGNRLNFGASPYSTPNMKQTSSQQQQLESGIRRGRPPTVDKPYETRIKLILKNFKKIRRLDDSSPVTPFERLPDKNTDYYRLIENPISLFEIRGKLRTKKYRNVDEFLNDLKLMFQNNKYYYGREQYSSIYQDCLLFEQEAEQIIATELQRLDQELMDYAAPGGDGIVRFPLDSLEMNGYHYRVGDWVLINNPNEPEKPTVGQIFRLWYTKDGTQYFNACWYYRPEQTSHRYDRLFFINEVCKTGQYRDHLATELVSPCYVIFLTRYQKGDLPKGIIPDGCPWFICEFRYNETTHVFNRIRTWRACLPDEIRDNPEPPVVSLLEPRRLIKYESPLKYLLPSGSDVTMKIPDVTEGPAPNTPPLLGSVYLREPDPEDDLGQYYTSPNITPSPENDDVVNNRKAYLFTPISQSKSVGYPLANVPTTPSVNSGLTATTTAVAGSTLVTPHGSGTGYYPPTGIQSPPRDYNDSDKSFLSGINRFKPLLQQQYPPLHNLTNPHQQSESLSHPPPVQAGYAGTSKFKPDLTRKQGTPVASGPTASYHTTTSNYSSLLPGGTVSYTIEDVNNLKSVSAAIDSRQVLNEDDEIEGNDIIWYRGPPVSVANKIISPVSFDLGHSSKYLSWKLRQKQ